MYSNLHIPAGATMPDVSQSAPLRNKVLLIEDNPGDARLVEIFLQESDLQNCEVINKTTLMQGMEALQSGEEFAAVLLDLSLPDSRGIGTLERLVAHFPHNNIIVLTGLADKETGLRAVKAGAQDYLIKGAFDSELLARSLRFSIERNKVLKKLEDSQRVAHIGNWEFFPASGAFSASDELYRIFGCPVERVAEAIRKWQDPASPLHVLAAIHEEALHSGQVKKDLTIRQLNGQARFISVQCLVQRSEEAEQVVFTGILQDITERKQAEQEMVKSRERYQEIFTQSKDAIFICTLEGQLIDFNQSTQVLFGLPAEALHQAADVHTLFHPAERRNEFLLKLRNRQSVKDFDLQIAHSSGEVRECMMTANYMATGEFSGYNCSLRDVTALRQAEKIKKARDLARQSARMKEQFLASISHEMRTPMNAILGMSNILLQMDMAEEQNGLVKSIKNSSEILLGVVNDILEISAIQNGKIVFENEPFDLQDVLNNLINVMQYKAQEKDLFLEIILQTDVPRYITGDKLRLNQVLYNLVGNAIKFTDRGYVKIHVKKLYDIGNNVQLKFEVEDTGIGISNENIEAVFETFSRVLQKNRMYEGTGLGLSICKNLVELQGGKIGAFSEFGKGSVFHFDLIFEMATALLPARPSLATADVLPHDATFRVLLVEDHKINQMVARKTLEKKWENLTLVIAENGQEAVDMLLLEDFNLILMDIQMPVMDGYEATQYIRNNFPPQKASIPILAMTAHAHISKDEKFIEYGMNDFVLKPFEPDDLFNKISIYVKRTLS